MGAEVAKDQTLRDLWLQDGRDRVRHDQIAQRLTPFHYRIIKAYIDYRDFKIPPWKRGADSEDIPPFWLALIRNFMRLDNEAQTYKQQKVKMESDETYQRYLKQEQKQKKKKEKDPEQKRQAGTEQAARDYMEWRQKQIRLNTQQRERRHQQLVQRQQQQAQQRRRRRR